MTWTKGIPSFFGCILLCLIVGYFGGLFIHEHVTTWYAGLGHPSLTPPDWAFLPVWIVLYTLMGSSLYLILNSPNNTLALNFFAAQLVVSFLWNALFFGLESITSGLFTLLLLWFLVGGMITVFYKHSKLAALLNIPYFVWTSLAIYISFNLWLLNAAGE